MTPGAGTRRACAPSLLTDGSAVSSANVVVMSVAVRPGSNVDVLGHHTPDPVLTGTGRV